MEKRETKEVTIGKHTVVLNAYCTGDEYETIEQVYLAGAKLNVIGKDVHVEGLSATSEQDASKKRIELLVVSLDGDANEVAKRVRGLPFSEYKQILALVNEISGKKKETE